MYTPSLPILGHYWKHDLARSCFILEICFAILILKKNPFFFSSECGRQQQNNIWGLTSVCSMLTESYSASAPKARRKRKKWTTGIPETTPNSHKPTTWRFEDYKKFPKPPSSGGAAPETYQYRTGREKSRRRVQPAEVGILPQGFLRPQEQILWHGKDLPGCVEIMRGHQDEKASLWFCHRRPRTIEWTNWSKVNGSGKT